MSQLISKPTSVNIDIYDFVKNIVLAIKQIFFYKPFFFVFIRKILFWSVIFNLKILRYQFFLSHVQIYYWKIIMFILNLILILIFLCGRIRVLKAIVPQIC